MNFTGHTAHIHLLDKLLCRVEAKSTLNRHETGILIKFVQIKINLSIITAPELISIAHLQAFRSDILRCLLFNFTYR